MLIVADFISVAKKKGIPVGPGRGSAAGSLVAYSLQITDIDPLPYNLLFERFLNPERVSMPDIDIDFCQDRRDEVIDYVIDRYGSDKVAQVITFGKMLAKGVIRDVARVCSMPINEADEFAKLVPDELKITLQGAYEKEPKISDFIQSHSKGKEVWEFSLALEGLNRHAGVHAAGLVISNESLWKKTPLFRPSKNDEKVAKIIDTVYNSGVNFSKWMVDFHSFVVNVMKYVLIKDIGKTMVPAHYESKMSKYTSVHSVICLHLAQKLVKLNNELKFSKYQQELALTYLCNGTLK